MQPYPDRTYITDVHFSDLTFYKDLVGGDYAGGDQWPIAWADDEHLDTGWANFTRTI